MSNFMIVRGFPGSGKSTYVMREYTGLMFFETDMFNIVDGQYVWTVDRSREAIRLINEFTTSIFNSPNRPDFALCGVFGTFKNIINHICNARDHGYEIYIKTLKTQFECVHNVPKEAIQRFHETFMEDDEIKKCLEQYGFNVHFGDMPKLNLKFNDSTKEPSNKTENYDGEN